MVGFYSAVFAFALARFSSDIAWFAALFLGWHASLLLSYLGLGWAWPSLVPFRHFWFLHCSARFAVVRSGSLWSDEVGFVRANLGFVGSGSLRLIRASFGVHLLRLVRLGWGSTSFGLALSSLGRFIFLLSASDWPRLTWCAA